MGYIIAQSGAHNTGKTTATLEMAARLKKDNPDKSVYVLQEVAAECPYPINRETSSFAQEWIFNTQISRELELISKYDIVVSDRTAVDAIAYTAVAEMDGLAERMLQYIPHHMHLYREIHLRFACKNSPLVDDGIRSSCKDFQAEVEQKLIELYERLGLDVDAPGFFVA